MDRRRFLRTTGALGGAAVFGNALAACAPTGPSGGVGAEYHPTRVPAGSMLSLPASEAPIDHVVVLMMENRSFDHYFGWLSRDEGYLERGRSRYGGDFSIDARSHQSYPDPAGTIVDTFHLDPSSMANPWRGCGFEDPGHGWNAGDAQGEGGLLADGSNYVRYALGYYEGDDLPFHSRMARRFTTFDRYHCSCLTSTQTNRRYLHSAQSGGWNTNYIPLKEGGFQFDTIWDRLRRAQVPVGSYYSDVPSLAFWGTRMGPILRPIDQYFDHCESGKLPNVTFLDPPYGPWWQADDHPHADPHAGQRFLRDVFQAFVESPHWEHGLFVVTYDEWGGFFDHVRPPVLPDELASDDDALNFGQTGFRVPTLLASPYARPGYVDHRTYEHTSIMRFLEWRFLGAPPEGPGSGAAPWSLTVRDRTANNIGASLGATDPDPEVFDLGDLPLNGPTADCDGTPWIQLPGTALKDQGGPGLELQDLVETGYFEQLGLPSEPSSMAGTWANEA